MKSHVKLSYYRYAGRWLGLRIKRRCAECDTNYALLQQLMAELFAGEPVTLEMHPWLDHWWRLLLCHSAWHPPVLLVNGRRFAQGVVVDPARLVRHVADLLDSDRLRAEADRLPHKQVRRERRADVVVFHSPACPKCRRLLGWLDANEIDYEPRNVTASHAARQELYDEVGRLSLPVIRVRDQRLTGVDMDRLRTLLNIDPQQEKPPPAVPARSPTVDPARLRETVDRARAVLQANRVHGYTLPSPHLYPHQWNWDSGFIARGYLHHDPPLAYQEIRSLLRGQWSDGFIPHMIFNPDALAHFPGPEYWQAERSGRVPAGAHTSGIGQPPVHASMIADALTLDPDLERARAFLAEIYPALKRLHDFYYAHRDPTGESLIALVHPWESGLDNAPLWDGPLAAITSSSEWAKRMQQRYDELAQRGDRPRRLYIEKYSWLVQSLYERHYDWEAIHANHPFLVQDVLFNCVLARAEHDLARIAEACGRDPTLHQERAARTAAAINDKLWDPTSQHCYSFDLRSQQHLRHDTAFSYMPLYAGVCDPQRRAQLVEHLRTRCFCIGERLCAAIPSYDMCHADYQGEMYWRGPVWFNINWYLAQGLRANGAAEQADWIERSILHLVTEQGFYEYYEPHTGKGLGADRFSWTAALFIDLAASGRHAQPSAEPA